MENFGETAGFPNGRRRLPYGEDGLGRFDPPRALAARRAVGLGAAMDTHLSDPKEIIMKMRADWGHSSARRSKRILVNSGRGSTCLVSFIDAALQQRDVRRASDKAPHLRIAGASSASSLNGRLQANLAFLDDAIDLDARVCTPCTPL